MNAELTFENIRQAGGTATEALFSIRTVFSFGLGRIRFMIDV